MDDEIRLHLVDAVTGEYVRSIYDSDKLTVTTKKQEEGFKKKLENDEMRKDFVEKHGNFIFKSNENNDVEITESDEVRLAFISTYVDYNGALKLDSGAYITRNVLSQLINANNTVFDKWYSKMIKSKIIYKINGLLHLDKKYYTKGAIEAKNSSHTRIFITAMRNLYESNQGKNLSSLGKVFKLLPYISNTHTMLCWNPRNEKRPHIMTAKEVVELIGGDTTHVLRELKRLAKFQINDKPLFLFVSNHLDYDNDKILVNPLVFYNGKIKDYDNNLNFFIETESK